MPCQVEIEFMCDACDTVATVYPGLSPHDPVRPDTQTPAGWVVDDVTEDTFYCSDCIGEKETFLDL